MNDDAFSVLTPESSYWLGFLMADGSVDGKARMQIKLQVGDIDHLEKLRLFLDASNLVKVYPAYPACHFVVSSKKLLQDLAQFGVVHRKSQKAIKAHADLANNRDFWRGMIDGDGSVLVDKKGRPLIILVGCRSLMEAFAKFARQHCLVGRRGQGCVCAHGTVWSYSVGGVSAIEVIRHLYSDSVVALDRKKATAEEILSHPVDFYRKPRPCGAALYNAKLTKEVVCEIRASRGNVRQVDLAETSGVSTAAINAVQLGKTWVEGFVPKGAHNQRDAGARAKLTWKQVREIRAARGKAKQADLAKKFEISVETINAVQLGRTWKEEGLTPVARCTRRGEANAHAKLTWEKVGVIRAFRGKLSERELGWLYEVSPSTIYAIWSGRTWKQAPEQALALG